MTEPRFRVVITDCDFEMPPVIEQAELDPIGAELVVEQCFTEDALIEKVADADGLLEQYAPITARVVDALERCKVIVRYGTGMDPIDVAAATAKGIVVCNVRDYQVGEVADHTMGFLLALARHIVVYNDDVRAGVWDASGGVPERMERVEGQTLGLIGLGQTAQAVAARARAFGLRAIGHSPRAPDSAFEASQVERVPLDDLLRQSDFVSVHTPLRAQTHHLIGEAEIDLMKPSVFLINTARGAVVDNAALARALKDGRIAGAGLDVMEEEPLPMDSPLREAPNVIITPHSGFYSRTSIRILRREAAAEVARVLRGEPPKSLFEPE
ncbi:MAG: C-terminal binding protein [Chloroflexi bacterium]|nr:C-terminal binding protein [Chloroflexota bacterium]